MAVTQRSASKLVIPPPPSDDEMTESDCEELNPSDQYVVEYHPPSPRPHAKKRRNKCPGVRIVGNRIYDSENGKACHQCRQKTMDVFVECKLEDKDNNRICSMKYCYKCLSNRYGEIAEKVNQLSDWQCPKCRNICNCSACRKKIGLPPTGCLAYEVRAKGLSSVAEMLLVEGPQNVGTSPKKRKASSKNALTKEGSSDDIKKEEEMTDITNDGVLLEKKSKRTRRPKKAIINTVKGEDEEITERGNGGTDSQAKPYNVINLQKNALKTNDELIRDIPLPQGVDLTTVAGIDLPHEDVAHALQFLEFCKSFEEVLDLKKGQAESILQELTDPCSRVRGQYSVVVQFYIQLLSLMHKDKGKGSTLSSTNNESSWLQALEKFISESNRALMNLPSDCFAKDGVGYESLDPSKKLRLMNFLCDESLNTGDLRSWIEVDNSKLPERTKEAKGKVVAAKEKEKLLKQKMGDVAKAYMSKKADPSSIYEYENLVSQIKAEASQAHAETLEAIDMVPKTKQRSDAVRTDPVFVDGKGHTFWRLRSCSSETNILLQDIRICDSGTTEEKWFTYDKEKIKEVERYISSVRRKIRRIQVVFDRHAPEEVTSETSIKNET